MTGKNPHAPVYVVKEFVTLSVCLWHFDQKQSMTAFFIDSITHERHPFSNSNQMTKITAQPSFYNFISNPNTPDNRNIHTNYKNHFKENNF